MGDGGEHDAVTPVLQEGAHAVASHTQGCGVPLLQQLPDAFQKEVIREFDNVFFLFVFH